jgi:hypothetical protein
MNMPSSKLLIALLAASCLLIAQERAAPSNSNSLTRKVVVTKAERLDFPASGLLRIKKTSGYLTIEGWDNPGAEIITTGSTRMEVSASDQTKDSAELNKVSVKGERGGDELVVTMDFPVRHSTFDLDCHIRVPRNARIAIDRGSGDVYVDGVTGDVSASLREGQLTLHLPQDAAYQIHASSTFGTVNSDYPGDERHNGWLTGHRFVREEPGRKLDLKIGYGDIVILKTRMPQTPPITNSAPAASGAF